METPENDYIVIPNPLYDVVFKYLMEDNESAKILISTLINEKIKILYFEPVSYAEKVRSAKSDQEIQLFHMDFLATIEKPDGTEELIMIEIQKANLAGDIFRFKRYIATNFQRKKEVEIINPETQIVEKIERPIRLLPIFILNFRIENEINDLIIRTQRNKIGVFREKNLEKRNEFIDHLSFDVWIVQLPNLHKIQPEDYAQDEYKSKLYALLQLFDQNARKSDNPHRLLFLRHLFPEFLQRLILRLKAASAENPDLEQQMHSEDEYLAELDKRDNLISYYKEAWEKTVSEKEKAVSEKEKAVSEKEKAVSEKEKAVSEKEKAVSEKEEMAIKFAKSLKKMGFTDEKIQQETGLSMEIIKTL